VLDGAALSRHLVPKKADEENSRQGIQAGQGEEQQVQFIDRVERKVNGKSLWYVVLYFMKMCVKAPIISISSPILFPEAPHKT